MLVLTVNAGSSSIRLDVFAAAGGRVRRTASHHGDADEEHAVAIIRRFRGGFDGAVTAIAHRVVHGGAELVEPRLLDASVERSIGALAALAPLHNPAAIAWIRACREVFAPGVPHVAVFDTAFFADLPEVARSYALPQALTERYGLRRYGFHGIAHRGMWRRWSTANPERNGMGRVVTLQLGSGASIAAILDGRAADSSMGFSPLEGLVMATRSGDVDPGLLLYLQREAGLGPAELEKILNEQSGLQGLAGESDMRKLLASTDPKARLAVDLYCQRARKYLGAFLSVLGGADGIVFGGGVGTNAPQVRAAVLRDMAWAGIQLDAKRNRSASENAPAIHADASTTAVYVLPADEAELLAEEAWALLGGPAANEASA
jgi:acetate kinase